MGLINFFIQFYISQNGEIITKELAKILVEDFAVTDGSLRSNGEKWNIQECKTIGNKYHIDWNTISLNDWYVILNKAYSLFYKVAEKLNLINVDFFASLSLAWFYDVNWKENQTFNLFCKS